MDKLVNQGVKPLKEDNNELNLGPIQTVFSLNLRDSLMAYQQFFDQMRKEK